MAAWPQEPETRLRRFFTFPEWPRPEEDAMELTTRCTDQPNESTTTSGSRLGGVMELPRNSDHPRGVLGIPELGTPDCWIEDMIEEG